MKYVKKNNNINLNWKFFRGDDPKAWYKGFDDTSWRSVTLPHDWSVEEPFSSEHSSGTGYLPGGIGWYRKSINLAEESKDKKVYITFEGVYNNSQVWCNSYYLGKRPYGYSTFTYDITPFVAFGEAENVISVKVNHRDIADSRWFTGSGIYRDVYITVTDNVHIDNYGVFVATPEVSEKQATMLIKVKVLNETPKETNIKIKNTIMYKTEIIAEKIEDNVVIAGEGSLEVEQAVSIQSPKLWSPDMPHLYTVLTEIIKDGVVIDNVESYTGIRTFKFDPNEGFFLNDVNMKIKGVCVHHDAGCLGAAVTKKVWERRLKLLKEMGCNAIRMSHNPPTTNLLDLCDSMGFLVIDEAFDEWEGVKNKWSTGHNVYPPKHYGYYEDFPEWNEVDIKDMVRRDRNHPSIILWSIGNEVDYPNDPYCHPSFENMTGNNDANKPKNERQYDPNKPNAERLTVIAKRLVKYVKECDPTRPVTSALAFPELSNITGYAQALDIVGYNYKEHLYEEDHKKFPSRVTYGSENGAHLEAWLAVKDNDYICGQFIWTGIDYMGEAKGWPVRVAQPGFLNLAGFKKTSYYYRQSLWQKEPMIFLTTKNTTDLGKLENQRSNGDIPCWNWNKGEKVKSFCYTNCEEVELFLNGKSIGIKYLRDFAEYYITWDIEYEEGTLEAIGRNSDGKSCTCQLSTTYKPQKLVMYVEDRQLKSDGQDIAHIEIQVVDDKGKMIYLAEDSVKLSIIGPGEILGIENGDPKDLEPYSSLSRKVYQGRQLVYVRSTSTPGTIIITAEAENMLAGEVIIESIN